MWVQGDVGPGMRDLGNVGPGECRTPGGCGTWGFGTQEIWDLEDTGPGGCGGPNSLYFWQGGIWPNLAVPSTADDEPQYLEAAAGGKFHFHGMVQLMK